MVNFLKNLKLIAEEYPSSCKLIQESLSKNVSPLIFNEIEHYTDVYEVTKMLLSESFLKKDSFLIRLKAVDSN